MEDNIVARALADVPVESLSLTAVVYRSVAPPLMTAEDLGSLLAHARERNAREQLTGLLIYTGTHFFQWLEGPTDGVERVWSSIQRDPRHHDIELLGRPRLPVRLFRGWEMGLAATTDDAADGVDDALHVDDGYVDSLEWAQHSMSGVLEKLSKLAPLTSVLSSAPGPEGRARHVRMLCLDHVLPLLQAQHGVAPLESPHHAAKARPRMPRIDPAFVARFADHLRSAGLTASDRIWGRLRGIGVSVEALCNDLVEPTARHLGDLWADDRCTGADLSMAVSELLSLLRSRREPFVGHPGQRRVLITALPGSFNVLGPVLAAEQLTAMRLDVDCLFPETGEDIAERLAESDVDTVVITLDPIHLHSIDAADLDAVVQAARASVKDRELQVLLYGRQVADEPDLSSHTHTDAAYATLAELNGAEFSAGQRDDDA